MKKSTLLFALVFAINLCFSQQNDTQYLLTSKSNSYEMGNISVIDPYLSPLVYDGVGIGYFHKTSSFFTPLDTVLSWQSNCNIKCAILSNPTKTATMTYVSTNCDWGLYYHFQAFSKIRFLVGGTWNIDLGLRSIMRNVNNPVNLDLATNLNASILALYDFNLLKRNIRTQLGLQSPLLGYMFVPQGGESYYEIFSLGNLSNTTHFSSVHNKRGIKGNLSLDFPFNRSVWRFGLTYEYLKYKANDLFFKRKEFTFLVGTTFDIATFGGRKNRAPRNFKSTNL